MADKCEKKYFWTKASCIFRLTIFNPCDSGTTMHSLLSINNQTPYRLLSFSLKNLCIKRIGKLWLLYQNWLTLHRQVSNLLSHIILLFFVLTEKSIILGFKNRNLEPRLKGGIEVLCSTTLQSFSSSYSPATTSHEFIIGWTSSSGHWRIQCLKTTKILLNLTLFILCSSFSS